METDPSPVRRWSKRDQLWIKLYPALSVFSREVAGALADLLSRHLPRWSEGLGVAKHADARPVMSPGWQRALSEVLTSTVGVRRGLGSAVLKGAYRGVRIYLDACDTAVPPELNHVAIEIGGLAAVEGVSPDKWALAFFEDAVGCLSPRYGNARLEDEFARKNLVDDQSGLRAIGVRLEVSLPGMYWLNYFGDPYVDLLTDSGLLSVPAPLVKRAGRGVIVGLADSPFSWDSDVYRERERQVIAHLGTRYFFDRSDPARQLLAPRFRDRMA